MKTAAAFAVAFLGLLLILGSCVPASLSAWRTFGATAVLDTPLPSDTSFRSERLSVRPDAHVQVGFALPITTSSVQQDGTLRDIKYTARYEFPFSWRALDAQGGVLAEQTGVLAWKGGTAHLTLNENTTSTGSTLTVEHRLDKFPAPADGIVIIEASLGTDTKYLARADGPSIRLYDGMQVEKWSLLVFAGMFLAGLVLAVGGFIFAVAAMASGPAAAIGPAAPTAADGRRYAALCHVFALGGYVIPFGHIFGPLIGYLAFREQDPFVADQGREALNFNLSVTIYMCVAALLLLLLVGFLLLPALAIFHFALIIVATVAASNGRAFRYPLTIRFVQ